MILKRTLHGVGRVSQSYEFLAALVILCPTTDRWVLLSWRTTSPSIRPARSSPTSVCWALFSMRALMSPSCGCCMTAINSWSTVETHTRIRSVPFISTLPAEHWLWPLKARPLYFTTYLLCQHRWNTSHGISTKLGQ